MNTEYVRRALLFPRPKKGSQSWLRRLGPKLCAAHWPLMCTKYTKNLMYEYYYCGTSIRLEWEKMGGGVQVREDMVGRRRQALAP